MKLNTIDREYVSSGLEGAQTMSVSSSTKILDILVDNMYSNKPGAIWREILSNTIDAHKLQGTSDVPVDIHYPDLFELSFKCRDYGTGLSHSFMMNEYCVVGHSTKENTNEEIGKWGLGRLVPLSYVDTYTVVSYFNGTKRTYAISRKGCTPLGKEDTSEPNGLEISFPIERSDLDAFTRELENAVVGLKVKPRVINKKDHSWVEVNTTLKGNNWSVFDFYSLPSRYILRGDGPFVNMGGVIYSASSLREKLGLNRWRNCPLILEVPIGSVGVTASRENLSFGKNDPTERTIITAYKAFLDDVEEMIQKKVDAETSPFMKWQAENLARSSVSGIQGRSARTPQSAFMPPNNACVLKWTSYAYKTRVKVSRTNDEISAAGGKYAAVVEDISEGKRDVRAAERIYLWWKGFKEEDRPQYLLWYRFDEQTDNGGLTSFLEFFDGVPVYTVRDHCPDIPKSQRVLKAVKIKRPADSWSFFTDAEVEDFEKGGYYVRLNRSELEDMSSDFARYATRLYTLQKAKPDVFAVPKTHWKRFEDHPKWKRFDVELNRVVKKLSEDIAKKAEDSTGLEGCNSEIKNLANRGIKLVDSYLSDWNSPTFANVSGRDFERMYYVLLGSFPTYPKLKEKHRLEKLFKERYPLALSRPATTEQVVKYIKQVDFFNKHHYT